MENAETILVIILSITLAIFLVVSIILGILMIRFVKSLNAMAEKAQDIVDNVESASVVLKNAAGPLAIGKFIMNIADLFKKGRGK